MTTCHFWPKINENQWPLSRRSREFGHTMFAQTDAFPLLTNCKIFANFLKREDKILWPYWQDIRLFGGSFGGGLALSHSIRKCAWPAHFQITVTIKVCFWLRDQPGPCRLSDAMVHLAGLDHHPQANKKRRTDPPNSWQKRRGGVITHAQVP